MVKLYGSIFVQCACYHPDISGLHVTKMIRRQITIMSRKKFYCIIWTYFNEWADNAWEDPVQLHRATRSRV